MRTLAAATALCIACLSLMTFFGGKSSAMLANTREEQEEYLRRFAYMGSSSQDPRFASITDPETLFQMAVKKFQKMAGLSETGSVDEETKKMMEMPRCGVRDEIGMAMVTKRRKRYAATGSRWSRTSLTYRINNFTPDLPQQTTTHEIRKAFQLWSNVSPLKFSEVNAKDKKVDIDIGFYNRAHGDNSAFDGKSGVLAHAYFPQNGATHFDEDEQWTSDSSSGINLLQVAIHEFGHALGLGHSDVKESIMAPFYRRYDPNVKLHSDDIAGIRYIYGTMGQQKDPVTSRPNFNVNLCEDSKPDAIFAVFDDIYVFKGSYYYVIGATGVYPGYPKMIGTEWSGLPNDIDTAFYSPPESGNQNNESATIYFFKDDKYWSYGINRQLKTNAPQSISSRFSGLPNTVDAAFIWSGNGRLYFIKGNQYYRSTGGQNIDSGYPLPLKYWKGLPSTIDAAFQYTNSRTYFFSGSDFYRYNDVDFKVDRGYPKSTAMWWLGCSGAKPDKFSDYDMVKSEWMKGGDQFLTDDARLSYASVGLMTSAILTFVCAYVS